MKSPSPEEVILEEIASCGPLSFARFMELALYHPETGFYSSGRAQIGKAGDFFTNVSVGPMYGRILACQLLEMSERLGFPDDFTIVEQGANDGRLAADILSAWEDLRPGKKPAWIVVEPFGALRQKQTDMLSGHNVRWVETLEGLPEFAGVHLSNELIDAFPFHLMRFREGVWQELFVQKDGGELAFVEGVPSLAVALPDRAEGYTTEVRESHRTWLKQIFKKMRSGYLLAVDYGMSRDRLYAPHRTSGTYCCYSGHQRDERPLELPGRKDITAHVDFTALVEDAMKCGFSVAGFTDQHHFLVGAAEPLLRSFEGAKPDGETQKDLRALQTLMHPESMGTQFHAICFTKNVPSANPLLGFRYARDFKWVLFSDTLAD